MGIFELVCPSCGEVNSVDAEACRCGHIFNAVTGSYEAAQLTLQEEEAYLEYIEARLGQLNYDKKFAKSDIEANPGVAAKKQRLEEIRQEIAELKAQREAQLVKIRATRKVNEEFRQQVEKEKAEARAKAEAEALRLKREQEKAEALKRAKEEQERKRLEKEAAEKKAREEAARKKKEQEEAARKAKEEAARIKKEQEEAAKFAKEEAARRAALEKQAREAEENQRKLEAARIAKEAEARRQQEKQQRVLAETERVKKQAAAAMAKADMVKKRAAMSKNKSASSLATPPGAGQISSNVHEKPSVSMSDAVEEIPQATTQECPICTAELPLDARQCACGYSFDTSASDMPSLSSGDFFAPAEPEAGVETQECPVCTAELPIDAKACNCGYQFPTGESTMPGLSLDGGLED